MTDASLSILLHETPPERCSGGVAVVIDVLRWTTTGVTALAQGATAIEPFVSIEEARARAAAIGALTAGERGGHRVPGFDLGNSPLEFTAARVAGRIICATTTNGTRAVAATTDVRHRFIAAFVNLRATADAIRALAPTHVDLVCAGTDGHTSDEDTACAEALMALLRAEPITPEFLQRAAHAAHAAFLREAGYTADVDYALQMDSVPLVAVVRAADGATRITALTSHVSSLKSHVSSLPSL